MRESPALKIIALLGALGADVVYHDPHVPELPDVGLRSASRSTTRSTGADLALIVTAHPGVDHDAIAERAPLVVDLRGVTRGARRAPDVVLPVSDAPLSRRRRRPRLLGPEPRAQLRRAARRRAALVLRRPRRGRASATRRQFPTARFTAELDDLLDDPQLDASCSPRRCRRHAELAVRVLEAGKHCFVEKPLAQSVADAERAVDGPAAVGQGADGRPPARVPPGRQQAQGDRRLGRARRHPLHLRQPPEPRQAARRRERALEPRRARRLGRCCTSPARSPTRCPRAASPTCATGVEDVVFGFLRFPSGLAAHLHLSWLDPHKERRFTVVGSKRMATFDDMDLERKITIYDKGFDESAEPLRRVRHALGRHLVARRSRNAEPLRLECEHFVECVRDGARADLRRRAAACASCACSRACRRSLDESRRRRAARLSAAPCVRRRARAPPTTCAGLLARRAPGSSGSPGGCGRPRRSPGSSTPAPYSRHRRLAVDRRAVVGLVADARRRCERGGELVGVLAADDVQVPGRLARPPTGTGSVDELAEAGLLVVARRRARRPSAQRVEVRQLHAQDRGLQLVEARVVAHVLVGDLVPASRGSAASARGRRCSSSLVVIAPPSPKQPRFLDGKKLNVASVPSAPGRPAVEREPAAWAASSMHRDAERLDLGDRRDVAEEVHGDDGLRPRRQRGRTVSGVTQNVSGSTSQNTGRAPVGGIASALA